MSQKIPLEALLKFQNQQIGELKSYIQELEDKLKHKSDVLKGSPEALLEGNRIMRERNKRQQERINELLKENDKLKIKLQRLALNDTQKENMQ